MSSGRIPRVTVASSGNVAHNGVLPPLCATCDHLLRARCRSGVGFHRFIWEQSGNRTLYNMLDQLSVPLFASVSIVRGLRRENLADVIESHEGIVEALRRRDRVAIHKALRQHFEYGFPIPRRE
jgi:DNA-binding FadR family transcriptional regulator